jgi:hypothetical protein
MRRERRAVRELHALAFAGEHDDVLAHDVPAAQRREPDRALPALAGRAFARVDAGLLEVDARAVGGAAPSISAVPDGASTLCRWCISTISMS